MPKKERYIGVEEARAKLGAIAAAVARGGAPFILTKRGHPLAVLISLDRYQQTKGNLK